MKRDAYTFLSKDGAFDQLLGDVTRRVFDVYGDSTVVYPGHGDDTTLGAERPQRTQNKPELDQPAHHRRYELR